MRAGRLDTGLVGRRLTALIPAGPPPDILPAAAVLALAALEPSGDIVLWKTGKLRARLNLIPRGDTHP